MADGKDSIDFIAKYKDWVAIKKMSIFEDTKPEEVAFHLAGIRQRIDVKAFEILGIDIASLDAYAAKLTNGMRKSYANLAEAMQQLGSSEAKAAVSAATKGKPELEQVAAIYLLRKVVQDLGFDFDVSQEMLAKAYPDLKIPKPLGRHKKE
ncbi:MAG: DUF2666 family protein [Candidatus Micrarchaeaceae archaeon]